MKKSGLVILMIVWFLALESALMAQCPMCKANVEAARNNGFAIGNGLNTGILYLLASPYVLVGTIGIFWYWNTRKKKQLIQKNHE